MMIDFSKYKLTKEGLLGFLQMVRLKNLLILVVTQCFFQFFLLEKNLLDVGFLVLLMVTTIVAAAGYIINDYYDVKIDIINKPDKVVVGKHISRRVTLGLNFFLNIVACLLALYLGKLFFGLVFLTICLLWWYSNFLKRVVLLGNMLVAFITALSLVLLPLYYDEGYAIVLLYASFAFCINLIREIIKDMEDMEGDQAFGCRTLPIVIGISYTKYLIYLFIGMFVGVLVFGYFYLATHLVFYLGFAIVLPLVWLVIKLYRADTTKHFAALTVLCKWIMILGLCSILFV